MGIKPAIGTFNDTCQLCYPADETPQLLKLFVSGIVKSPNFPAIPEPAPNGYADLLQTLLACEWFGDGLTVPEAYCNFWVHSSRVHVKINPFLWAFASTVVDVCESWFENAFVNPATNAYTGGYAFLCTPAQIQSWIELAMPVTGPDPRFELFPMENRQIVIRFASTQDGTNLKLRLDVDDLP